MVEADKIHFTEKYDNKGYLNILEVDSALMKASEEKDIILCPGSKFKKEEYTATDNYDGDVTSKVEVVVEEDKAIYSVTDKSGNTTKVKKNLIYKDEEAPILTLNGNDIKLGEYSPFATAYGVGSKGSSLSTPANGDKATFLGKLPPAPRVYMSSFSASFIKSHTESIDIP